MKFVIFFLPNFKFLIYKYVVYTPLRFPTLQKSRAHRIWAEIYGKVASLDYIAMLEFCQLKDCVCVCTIKNSFGCC